MKCGGETSFSVYNAIPASQAVLLMTTPSIMETFSPFNVTLSPTIPSLLAIEAYSLFDASGMGVSSQSPVLEYVFPESGILDVVGQVELKHKESGQLSNVVTTKNVTASAKMNGTELRCPRAVSTNSVFECVLRIAKGSEIVASVKFGSDSAFDVTPTGKSVRHGDFGLCLTMMSFKPSCVCVIAFLK